MNAAETQQPTATWRDIVEHPSFQGADAATRDQIRGAFFDQVVRPMTPEPLLGEVEQKFRAGTEPDVFGQVTETAPQPPEASPAAPSIDAPARRSGVLGMAPGEVGRVAGEYADQAPRGLDLSGWQDVTQSEAFQQADLRGRHDLRMNYFEDHLAGDLEGEERRQAERDFYNSPEADIRSTVPGADWPPSQRTPSTWESGSTGRVPGESLEDARERDPTGHLRDAWEGGKGAGEALANVMGGSTLRAASIVDYLGDEQLRRNVMNELVRAEATLDKLDTLGDDAEGQRPMLETQLQAAARNLRNIANTQLSGDQRGRLYEVANAIEAGEYGAEAREQAESLDVSQLPEPPSARRLFETGQSINEWAAETFAPGEGYEDSLVREFGGALGSLGGFTILSALGGPAASFSAAGLLGVVETYDRALAAGESEADALEYALRGAPAGVVQALPAEFILGRLPPKIRNDFMRKAADIGNTMLAEFAVENLGQILQNNIAKSEYNPEQDLFEGTPYAGLLSGSAAGVLRAVVMMLPGRRVPGMSVYDPSVDQQLDALAEAEGREPSEGDLAARQALMREAGAAEGQAGQQGEQPMGLAMPEGEATQALGENAAWADAWREQGVANPYDVDPVTIAIGDQGATQAPQEAAAPAPGLDMGQGEQAPESGMAAEIEAAAQQTDTNPTPAQAEAGNYRKGRVRLHGMEVSIENPRGSTRRGTAPDGTPWESQMAHHYGDIKRTEGADGDSVDVFIGERPESRQVFVIDQVNAEGRFDEHKVMMGFDSLEAAQQGYLANYEDGWRGLGDITSTDVDGLRAWLSSGDTAQPFAAQMGAEAGEGAQPVRAEEDRFSRLIRTAPGQLNADQRRARDAMLVGDGYTFLRERAEASGRPEAVEAVDRMQTAAVQATQAEDAVTAGRLLEEASLAYREAVAGISGMAAQEQPASSPRPAAASAELRGTTETTYLPDNTPVETQFRVVELGDLVASNTPDGRVNPAYPQALQPRDRSNANSQVQVRNIAARLNPERLGASADAGTGAPIVGADGVVESGNGRTMALSLAYQQGGEQAEAYRRFVREQAAAQGIDPAAIDGMSQPVLVRERTSDIDRAEFGRRANESQVAGMTAYEQAMADADALTSGDLRAWAPDQSGDPLAASNRDFQRLFVSRLGNNEAARYTTREGRATPDLGRRMSQALFAKAYRDADMVEMATEQSDQLRNLVSALQSAAPELAMARESGSLEVLATIDAINDAVRLVRESRREGVAINELANQTDAFSEPVSPLTAELAMLLDSNARSRVTLERALTFIAQDARRRAESEFSGALFEDTTTTEDAVREGFRQSTDPEAQGQRAPEADASGRTGQGQRQPSAGREADSAQGAPEAPPVTLKADGQPFQTRRAAELSKRFRDTPGAVAVEVEGGWGFTVPVDARQDAPLLETYTEQDVAQREQTAQQAQEAEAQAQREAEQRAAADREADDFTLAGSNLPADQAAARGQDSLFAFAGERAETADARALSRAEEMLADGADAEQVRRETGWFQGVDGRWRFEINDRDARLLPALAALRHGPFPARRMSSVTYRQAEDGSYSLAIVPEDATLPSEIVAIEGLPADSLDAMLPAEVAAKLRAGQGEESILLDSFEAALEIREPFDFDGFNALPLDQALEHPALFAAYPRLREAMVQVDPEAGSSGSFAVMLDGTPMIRVGTSEQLSVMLHEIQHAIQAIEGFAYGGRPSDYRLPPLRERWLTERVRELSIESGRRGLEMMERYRAGELTQEQVTSAIQRFAEESGLNELRNELSSGDERGALRYYRRLGGEVEARNVQRRQGMTDAERLERSPRSTQDYVDSEIVIVFGGREMASAPMPANAATEAPAPSGVDANALAAELLFQPGLEGVRAVQTVAELPSHVLETMMAEGIDAHEVAGAFDMEAGQSYVVADNVTSIEDGIRRAVHEEIGHRGIRAVLGAELEPVMLQVYQSYNVRAERAQVLRAIRERYSFIDTQTPEGRLAVAEELVAHVLETSGQASLRERVVSTLRAALRRLFPRLEWTDADIRRLGREARRYLSEQQRLRDLGAEPSLGLTGVVRGEGPGVMSVADAQRAVDAFMERYQGNVPVEVRVGATQQELYGPRATREAVGTIKGAYHPARGVMTLVANNARGVRDVQRTLRHEILGHYGLNTFTPAEKRALLERVLETRNEPSLAEVWQQVGENYGDRPALLQAEEVFAHVAEMERGALGQMWDRVLTGFQRALRVAGLSRSPLRLSEIHDLVRQVGRGIRDGSRQQQTFPASDQAQFSRETVRFSLNRRQATGEAVREALAGSNGLGRSLVFDTADAVPLDTGLALSIRGINHREVVAFTHNGRLHVIAGNAATPAEAVRAAVLETVRQKGLADVAGPKAGAILNELRRETLRQRRLRDVMGEVRAEFDYLDLSVPADRLALMTEVMTRAAERGETPAAVEQAQEQMREALAETFPAGEWGVGDAAALGESHRFYLRQQQRDFGQKRPAADTEFGLEAVDGPGMGTLLDLSSQVVDADGNIIGDARIESTFRSMVRLTGFFESATDRLRRSKSPVLAELARRVDAYYDQSEKRVGLANGILRPAFLAMRRGGRSRRKANERAFKEYMRHHDNGRAQEAQAILEENAAVAQMVDAVQRMFDEAGTINQTVKTPNRTGLWVFDSKTGGYRKIGKIGGSRFWPRVLRQEVQAVIQNPTSDTQLWHQLLDALVDEGHAETRKQAAEYLRGKNGYFSSEATNDYFAGIEKARGEKLPEIFYDYSLNVVVDYAQKWSDRVSQVEQFGQKLMPADLDAFEEASKVAVDSHTREYISELASRVYNRRPTDAYHQGIANLNLLATGSQLGNPGTATLNLIGGTQLNVQMFGARRVAAGYAELVRDFRNLYQEGVELGILGKDMLNIMRDAESSAHQVLGPNARTRDVLSHISAFTMKWGGYTGTEQLIRANAMLAARSQLMDALNAWNTKPDGVNARKYRRFMERNRLDVAALLRENGKGEETARYLRLMVNIPQGSYRVDQTPLYVDTPIGKFMFKYQKFGTQVARLAYQQMFTPFWETLWDPSATMRDKTAAALPILRWFAWAYLGGAAIRTAREAMFGYLFAGPDWEEIIEAFKNDEQAMAWGWVMSHAFHNMMAGSAFGFFGNYIQMGLDIADRQRVKNPLDPPGLASVDASVELFRRLMEQGKLTTRDWDQVTERFLSLYRTGMRGAATLGSLGGLELDRFRLEQKRRDFAYIRQAARRYADANGIEARRTTTGRFGRTERTPENQAIYEAVLLGDRARAQALVDKALEGVPKEEESARLQSIQASLRARQPVQLGGPASQEQVEDFLFWAEKHLPASKVRLIRQEVENYRDMMDAL